MPPPRSAADGGNRWLAQIVLNAGQFDVKFIQQASHVGRRLEHREVQARTEAARHRARQHDGADLVVGRSSPQRRYKLLEQR